MANVFVNWGGSSFSGFGGSSASPATGTVTPSSFTGVIGQTQALTATSPDGTTNFLWSDGGAGGSFSVNNAAATVYTLGAASATITATPIGVAGSSTATGTFPSPSTNHWAGFTGASPQARTLNGITCTFTQGTSPDPLGGNTASKVVFTTQTGDVMGYNSGDSTTAPSLGVTAVFSGQFKWVPTVPGTPITFAFSNLYYGTSNAKLGNGQVAVTLADTGTWITAGKVYTTNATDVANAHYGAACWFSPAPDYITGGGGSAIATTYGTPAGTLYFYGLKSGPV